MYTRVYSCVHVGIQLYTRGYTVVYARVYSSLLDRRYLLGISMLGHRYFYLRRMLLDDLALALWLFHASALGILWLSCRREAIFPTERMEIFCVPSVKSLRSIIPFPKETPPTPRYKE